MSNRRATDTFKQCSNTNAKGVCMYRGPCLECAFNRARAVTLEEQIVDRLLSHLDEYVKSGSKAKLRDEFTREVRALILTSPGVSALSSILQRMRSDDQGGYPGRHNGKWGFVSSGLPQTTPAELDKLFALAGIVPDEIFSLGSCDQCANAKVFQDGSRAERGYEAPCISCKRPRMSNFVPLHKVRTTRIHERPNLTSIRIKP